MGKFRNVQTAPPSAAPPPAKKGKGVLRTNTDPALAGITNALEDQVIRAGQRPGPADYGALHLAPPKGGRFNASDAKSGLEWEIYRAQQLPGPAEYPAPELSRPNGGRFSSAFPKSDVEWQMYRAARQPGPTEYGPVATDTYKKKTEHAQLGVTGYQNDLDGVWHIRQEQAAKPGPGAYPGAATDVRIGGGKFNKGKAKSDLEWQMYRAKQLPGPASYDMPTTDVNGRSATVSIVGGGKWNRAVSKSGLEWDIYRAQQLPGPDYDTNAAHQYLEGKAGAGPRKGARILGRAGYNLPAPFNAYYRGSDAQVRSGPSISHGTAVTGFRQAHAAAAEPEPEPEPEEVPKEGRPKSSGTDLRHHLRVAISHGRSINGVKVTDAATLFAAVDKDKQNGISRQELKDALQRLGLHRRHHATGGGLASAEEIGELVDSVDTNGDDAIGLSELEAWLRLGPAEDGANPDPEKHSRAMVRKILELADMDKDGKLSRFEFVELQERCGRPAEALTVTKWHQMCEAFGADATAGIGPKVLQTMYERDPPRLVADFKQLQACLSDAELQASHERRAAANGRRRYRPRPPGGGAARAVSTAPRRGAQTDRSAEQLPPRLRRAYAALSANTGGMAMTERGEGAGPMLTSDELKQVYASGPRSARGAMATV